MIDDFLKQVSPPFTGAELFDHVTDVVYFVKDIQAQYLVVNQTLVTRCGVANKSILIGKTASAVLRAPFGDRFATQDEQVLRTGKPLITQLELHVYPTRDVGWCLTTKLPLRNDHGKIIGLVGISQDLRLPDRQTDDYKQLASAVEYAEKNLAKPPTVPELAAKAKMSRYQLDRRMKSVFGLATGQWLVKIRLDAAQRLLQDTHSTIVSIALETGYSDQSAFTRQFRLATGVSPTEYQNAKRTS